MIDREKTIRDLEAIGAWHTHHYNSFHYECAETIHNALELLKEQEPSGWISVKDRLPERPGKYLVVSKTALAELPPHVKTAWFLKSMRDNSQFKYEGEPNEPGFYNGDGEGDWVERYVTYWMPLPKPPKEET